MIQAQTLFDDIVEVPSTESIKYIGSKLKLLPYILELVKRVDAKTVLDGFAGTTRVSQALAKNGYKVVCNDIAIWSKVFGNCYLLNKRRREDYQSLVDHLNALKPVDGWFTEHYGGYDNNGLAIQQDGKKRLWQVHNTRKLDSIRQEIEFLNLNKVDKSVLLTSLILALDKVDNTLGHFSSYLKNWAPRSYKELTLEVPDIFPLTEDHQIYQRDIFDVVPNLQTDVAYFDPPYGSNNEKMPPSRVRYAAYYHIWTTVCLFDNPLVFGSANRRKDSSDTVSQSVFEEFRRNANGEFIAVEYIDKLIKSTQSQWIILSYSSGGRATAEELQETILNNGKLLDVLEIQYKKNVMYSMKWTNEWVRNIEQPNYEFLFLIEK